MPRAYPSTPLRGGATAALCRLLLVLQLTVVATAHAAQQVLASQSILSRPYLATYGAPALRFQLEKPVPPPITKPVAGGPPVAASAQAVAEISLANSQAAASTPPMASEIDLVPTSEPVATNPAPQATNPETKPSPKALPILPDDTRRKVQSQDFLPLFRFPGSGGLNEDVTIITPGVPAPPAPAALPPSSATYRQY